MTNQPLYIFDLDGTLADCRHRLAWITTPPCPHCLGEVRADNPAGVALGATCPVCGVTGQDPDFKKNYRAFYQACVHDSPIWPMIQLLRSLLLSGAEVEIWTGRSDEVYSQTLDWLRHHTQLGRDQLCRMITMRQRGDFTPDYRLKEGWLDSLAPTKRCRLAAAFEDRQRVVDMWLANGVLCLQAPPDSFHQPREPLQHGHD